MPMELALSSPFSSPSSAGLSLASPWSASAVAASPAAWAPGPATGWSVSNGPTSSSSSSPSFLGRFCCFFFFFFFFFRHVPFWRA